MQFATGSVSSGRAETRSAVGAIAERFVRRFATTAEGYARSGTEQSALGITDLEVTTQVVRSVALCLNREFRGGRLGRAAIQAAVLKGAARTPLDHSCQRVGLKLFGLDPGPRVQVEHLRRSSEAFGGVRASIGVEGDFDGVGAANLERLLRHGVSVANLALRLPI